MRGRYGNGCLALVLLFSTLLAGVGRAATYYVDAAAADDSGAGTSWVTAKKTIQAAIDISAPADTVLVTNGVYNTGGITNYPFLGVLTNRIAIYKAITVMAVSTNPADTVIQGRAGAGAGGFGSNAVRCVYMTANTRLSGFTITNGYTFASDEGDATRDRRGGGIWCEATSAVISNCIIVENHASQRAGGVYYGTVYNSAVTRNSADYGGGTRETDLYSCLISTNVAAIGAGGCYNGNLTDCVISNNSAGANGGGSYQANLSNCVVIGNTAGGMGGGNFRGIIKRCRLERNTAGSLGGGGYQGTLHNCLIIHNRADIGGGHGSVTIVNSTVISNSARIYGGIYTTSSATNCIVYHNHDDAGLDNYEAATVTLNYCCTFPMPGAGNGNITNQPGFVNLGEDDYRLTYRSCCVDAGINLADVADDIDGTFRPLDGTGNGVAIHDIGVYEYVPPARGTIITFR